MPTVYRDVDDTFDDDVDVDSCTYCGRYYGWLSVKAVADAHPHIRPFPQHCYSCLPDDMKEAVR